MKSDNLRILIADDLPAIHADYFKILAPQPSTAALVQGVADFAPHFAPPATTSSNLPFKIESVMQGEDAIRTVTSARAEGRPFAMVFLDVRMPPGIDGVETAQRLRVADPDLQIVLCTAYSDYSFMEISRRFQESDGLLILKKPFDPVEVQQIAHALCRKWTLSAENKILMGNLETRVRQRTAELERAKAELEIALTRAESASRTKSDFLRCLSHELNTPLNGIMGAASLIESSPDPESAEMGKIVLQSSENLSRIFSRILLYLKIDSAPSTEIHLVEIQNVIESAVTLHRAAADAKGVAVDVHNTLPPSLWFNGEDYQLTQALSSLVENAVKFTSAGQVDVRLSISGGNLFIAEVVDTGPGIEGKKLANLYELFTPGDLQPNRLHEGIGIGLMLAKRIAEHLGGGLEHRNRDQGGSSFTLKIPCRLP